MNRYEVTALMPEVKNKDGEIIHAEERFSFITETKSNRRSKIQAAINQQSKYPLGLCKEIKVTKLR